MSSAEAGVGKHAMPWAEIDLEYVAGVLATAALMPSDLALHYRRLLCRGRLREADEAWLWQVEQRFRPSASAVEEQWARLRRDDASASERELCGSLLAAVEGGGGVTVPEMVRRGAYH